MAVLDLDDVIEQSEAKQHARASVEACTHVGNADRLARQAGGALIYALGIGWLAWDGQRYVPDSIGAPSRAVQDMAKMIRSEAAAAHRWAGELEFDSKEYKEARAAAKAIEKWARDSEMAHNIDSTLKVASNNEPFRVRPEDLDAHPRLLNCQNGTLDLDTFELHRHSRDDRLTKVAGASYDPYATAPNWEANLKRFIPDPEVRAYLQRCAGQTLYGLRSEEIQYLYGLGANFKSTFLRGLFIVAGDYAVLASPEILVAHPGRKSVSDKAEFAELRGARLVMTSEIEKGQRLAEGTVKLLTEDRIKGEFKYRDSFTFEPEASIWFSANYMLTVAGTDDGIWRRIRFTEWRVQLPAEERDPGYFDKHLAPELDGILAWCVRGAQDYHARGDRTDPPKQVQAWTQNYREQCDLVARWLSEECELDPAATTDTNDLWSSFEAFTKSEKDGRVPRSEWKDRLAAAGLRDRRMRTDDGQRRVYDGVKLTVSI